MPAHSRTELEDALAACKSSFLSVAFFSFFVNLLMLVPSFYMLQVYDRAVASASLSTLLMLTLIMLLLLTTMGGLEWVRSRIMVRISTRLDTLLGQRLFDASFKQALTSCGMNATAQPLSDLNALRQFLTGNGLFAFFDTPWIPIYLAVMFMFHPWYGWMGLLSAVLLGTLAYVNEKLTQAPLHAANREQMAATAFTNKSLRNAEVVESMGMLASLRQRWSEQTHTVLSLQSLASDRATTVATVSRTFRQVVQSLVLGLGAYLTINHEISSGLMIAGSILLGRALAPIDQLIGVWKGFLGARSQYARLHHLLATIAAEPERMSLLGTRGRDPGGRPFGWRAQPAQTDYPEPDVRGAGRFRGGHHWSERRGQVDAGQGIARHLAKPGGYGAPGRCGHQPMAAGRTWPLHRLPAAGHRVVRRHNQPEHFTLRSGGRTSRGRCRAHGRGA